MGNLICYKDCFINNVLNIICYVILGVFNGKLIYFVKKKWIRKIECKDFMFVV